MRKKIFMCPISLPLAASLVLLAGCSKQSEPVESAEHRGHGSGAPETAPANPVPGNLA